MYPFRDELGRRERRVAHLETTNIPSLSPENPEGDSSTHDGFWGSVLICRVTCLHSQLGPLIHQTLVHSLLLLASLFTKRPGLGS